MVKAVIFDMDGVIIDSEPIHVEVDKRVAREYGIELTDAELIKYVGITNPVMWSDLCNRYSFNVSIEELLHKQRDLKKEFFEKAELQAIDGILELLDSLAKSEIKIGLASSSPREFIMLILGNLGIVKYFNAIVSGDDVKNSKPAPDIFIRAAELLGVHNECCVVIEDSEHGVKAAKSAGMKCIGFSNPNSGRQDLSRADKVVDLIEHINLVDKR